MWRSNFLSERYSGYQLEPVVLNSLPLTSSVWQDLSRQLTVLFDNDFSISAVTPVAGGDINQSYCITGNNNRRLFVKLNSSAEADFFHCEAVGLNHIQKTGAIACPTPLLCGNSQPYAFLITPYHHMRPHGDEFLFGQQLAKMHQRTHDYFGFDRDNYIGQTPQINTLEACWANFFLENRITPQLKLAYRNGFTAPLKKQALKLLEAIPGLLADYNPQPSLVHGDLWGGNKGFLTDGTPIIFDPACYYGDREVDIAMTHLFGGFGSDFYRGYDSIWPLNKDYKKRMRLYNLYHQLNHLNLFGSSYLKSCIATIQSLAQQ